MDRPDVLVGQWAAAAVVWTPPLVASLARHGIAVCSCGLPVRVARVLLQCFLALSAQKVLQLLFEKTTGIIRFHHAADLLHAPALLDADDLPACRVLEKLRMEGYDVSLETIADVAYSGDVDIVDTPPSRAHKI